MSDVYKEILIKREGGGTDLLKKGGMIVLSVALLAAGLLVHPLFLAVAVAAGAATWYVITSLDLEYEYLYVNGDIDIDKIMNKQRRKRVESLELDSLELLAPAGSHELDSYAARSGCVHRDYTSGNEKQPAVVWVSSKERQTTLVKLELDREVLEDLRRHAPSKISRDCLSMI